VTLAQLGLPESFTPASTRLKTRMFPTSDGKTWEPYKIRQVKKPPPINGADVEMGGTEEVAKKDDEDEAEFEEDVESDEGAVWPLTGLCNSNRESATELTSNFRGSHYQYASIHSIAQSRTQHTQSYTSHAYSVDCTTYMDSPRS
jgi:hypothetical protein